MDEREKRETELSDFLLDLISQSNLVTCVYVHKSTEKDVERKTEGGREKIDQ